MTDRSQRFGNSEGTTPVSAYAVAVAAALVAAGIRWSLDPLLGPQAPFTIFFAAVVCAAWYGGVRPGLLALLLSFLLAEFLFLPPTFSFVLKPPGLISGLIFIIVGLSCVMLSGSLHQTRDRAVQAEQRLRDVLASMADDFLTVDGEWRITFINPHATKSMGRPTAILEGRNLWEAFPELTGTDLERSLRTAMTERRVVRSETSGPFTSRWLDICAYPTGNGIAIHGRDVSAIRRAEENARFIAEASGLLAQSLDLDQTISRVVDLAIPHLADWCFVDLAEADGSFRKVAVRCANAGKLALLEELRDRYTPDPTHPHPIQEANRTRRPELVSRVTDSWLQSRARDARHLELLRSMKLGSLMAIPLLVRQQLLGVITLASAESGREYTEADLRNAEALGTHISLAISNARLYQEAQAELRERKAVELALRESEGRFRTLVTATGAMVWRVAADGRVIDEPAGWEQVTGQPYAEFQDEPTGWFAPVHPEDVARVQNAWNQARATRRMVDVEFRLRHRNGEYRRMQTVGVPLLDQAGNVMEWIGTTVDVHEQREAEEHLQRAQRMETVGRLAGGMAHETNNQMMVILSFVDFLLRSHNLTDEQHRDLRSMGEAAERVSGLTRQLLALSQRQVLKIRALELDTVVLEAESVLRRTLGPEIRLSVQFEPGQKWVLADRTQMIQVLVNLALNARDAIRETGELTISTRRAEHAPPGGRLGTEWRFPGLALLSVADTGEGIDPVTLGRIFEPFFSTKPAGKGTGLGLPVVEGIISQSGGDIWVESKPGYGTVVTIGLPLTAEPTPEDRPAVTANGRGGTETVLVVDDEEQVRRLLVRGLRLGNYQVLEASGGAEAIAILEQEKGVVRLVITDIAMPVMNGVELADRIRLHWPHLPVLFISGHPFEVVTKDPGAVTMGRFLQKPFKVDTLLVRVRNALDQCD